MRRHLVRAGDANPAQLGYWTEAWLERSRAFTQRTRAHGRLAGGRRARPAGATAAAARLEAADAAWDDAITVIGTGAQEAVAGPRPAGTCEEGPRHAGPRMGRADRHRHYPMIGLDNNTAERALRGPVVTRKNAYGSRNEDAARLAARIWTVTATAEMPA